MGQWARGEQLYAPGAGGEYPDAGHTWDRMVWGQAQRRRHVLHCTGQGWREWNREGTLHGEGYCTPGEHEGRVKAARTPPVLLPCRSPRSRLLELLCHSPVPWHHPVASCPVPVPRLGCTLPPQGRPWVRLNPHSFPPLGLLCYPNLHFACCPLHTQAHTALAPPAHDAPSHSTGSTSCFTPSASSRAVPKTAFPARRSQCTPPPAAHGRAIRSDNSQLHECQRKESPSPAHPAAAPNTPRSACSHADVF